MWSVETLRLTAFQHVPVDLTNINWWADAVGSEPTQDNINRQIGELKQEGQFSNGILNLTITPSRIDWKLMSIMELEGELPARLGDIEEKTKEFTNLLSSWLSSQPSIHRLAFGLILVTPHEDHKAAYEHLNSCLPHVELKPNSTDFLYQINRPQVINISNLGELGFNRLSRWHAIKGGFTGEINGVKHERKFYASKLELDINTDARRVIELPSDCLSHILSQLVELATQISKNGDKE
jgi:hypothetical protein